MTAIRVKPVEIIGHCRAGLTLEDEFLVEGANLLNPSHSNLCIGSLGHLPAPISTLQHEKRFFAHARCQSCTGLERENRVIFLLGHADKWELCLTMSEYRRLCEEYVEPSAARQLKAEAVQHQRQGEYAEAVRKMGAALEELRGAAALQETLLYYNRP